MVAYKSFFITMFDRELISLNEILWRLSLKGDGPLEEILNTMFDWELIQRGFYEGGRFREMVAYKRF